MTRKPEPLFHQDVLERLIRGTFSVEASERDVRRYTPEIALHAAELSTTAGRRIVGAGLIRREIGWAESGQYPGMRRKRAQGGKG